MLFFHFVMELTKQVNSALPPSFNPVAQFATKRSLKQQMKQILQCSLPIFAISVIDIPNTTFPFPLAFPIPRNQVLNRNTRERKRKWEGERKYKINYGLTYELANGT